jgi:transposase-like protein
LIGPVNHGFSIQHDLKSGRCDAWTYLDQAAGDDDGGVSVMSQPVYTAEIAERILGHLSDGRSLRAVCRDEDMPSLNTVLKWVRDDHDGFAARYREACAIGGAPRGRPSLYTLELADRILRDLSDGRTLGQICGDPGMPSVSTVRNWTMVHADFAAGYRLCKEEGLFSKGPATLYSKELAEIIISELCSGRTLADVCRDPGMPSASTVRLWVIEDRDGFAEDYAIAREMGDDAMMGEIIEIVDSRRDDWMPVRKPDGAIEYVLDPQRMRRMELRVNARNMVLSKAMRRKHGARVDR